MTVIIPMSPAQAYSANAALDPNPNQRMVVDVSESVAAMDSRSSRLGWWV